MRINTGFVLYLIFGLLVAHNARAKGILDQVISIEIKNTPIKTILWSIEDRAAVKFSYNPSLIDVEREVSLSIKQRTIAYGLSLIFNQSVRFKEVGGHIILLKNEDVVEMRERKKANTTLLYKGKITDKRTGKPIANASIYDIDARFASISDAEGNYLLAIPQIELVRSLYFSKQGYHESVIVVDASRRTEILQNIQLEPKLEEVAKIDPRSLEPIYRPIEQRAISGGLVSPETYLHTENLKGIKESRYAQVSFVPAVSIGSNLSTNGLITNNFSLNILAGYSNGVDGAEIGGLLNMVNGDVRWFQVGGLANLDGGNFDGGQIGGLLNSVRGNFRGAQIGGLLNTVGGEIIGTQIGGIANLSHKTLFGMQVGGIANIARGKIYGFQVGGIFSAAKCGFTGFQLGGIATSADSLVNGVQISGIHNLSRGRFNGVQIGGISNYSQRGNSFFQAGGIGNMAAKNYGIQVAGIFNFAKTNHGLQIGLLNFSKEGKGLAIGLFNFVLKGYHKMEIYSTESFHANFRIKTGNRHFYNSYNFGVRFDDELLLKGGLGYGTNLKFNDKWSTSFDLTGNLVFKNNFENYRFNQLYQFGASLDFAPAKWITFYGGPTFNLNLMQFKDEEGNYPLYLTPTALFEGVETGGAYEGWIGWRLGIRF